MLVLGATGWVKGATELAPMPIAMGMVAGVSRPSRGLSGLLAASASQRLPWSEGFRRRTLGYLPPRPLTRRRFDPSSSPSATHIRRPDFSIDGWAENPQ